jgi:hypothetical protein
MGGLGGVAGLIRRAEAGLDPCRFRLSGLPNGCGSTWVEGGAGSPVTVVPSPGRRAAEGRPQGRP